MMVPASNVVFAVAAGLLIAPVTFAVYHTARRIRVALLDRFERLMEGIDDALSAELPGFLVDDEV